MGSYNTKPVRNKLTSDEEGERIRCGCCFMQGWEYSQEDFHNCRIEYDEDLSFFAVYDGHGGNEVAEYCVQYFPTYLQRIATFRNGNYAKALEEAFLGFDATLTKPEVVAYLKKIANHKSDEEDENPGILVHHVDKPKGLSPHSPFLRYMQQRAINWAEVGSSSEDGSSSSSKNSVADSSKDEDNEEENSLKNESNGSVEKADQEAESKTHDNGDLATVHTVEDNEIDEYSGNYKGKVTTIAENPGTHMRASTPMEGMSAQLHYSFTSSDSDIKDDISFHGAEESNEREGTEFNDCEEDREKQESEYEEDGEEKSEYEEDEDDFFRMEVKPGITSGSTMIVALLHGRDLYVANAGNSRCVVCREGKALDMSFDHTPADFIERERILNAGGYIESNGAIYGFKRLSRAIGIHLYKQMEDLPLEKQMIIARPDVRTLSLDPTVDEFMILACQGIWECMSSQDVVTFVRTRLTRKSNKKLSEICEELCDYCLAREFTKHGPGMHNMTAVIVQFLPKLANAESANLPNTAIKAYFGDCQSSEEPASSSEDSYEPSPKQAKIEEEWKQDIIEDDNDGDIL